MPSSGVSDGVQSAITELYPEAIFLPIETTGDGAVNVYSRVQAANVVVEYQHIGLGFAGNPYGMDIVPTVKVRLQGMVFNLITPVFSGLMTINMPDFATTLMGEDLQS